MKKIVLVVLTFACIVNFSCKKDKHNSEASIIGSWRMTKTGIYDGKTNNIFMDNTNDCVTKSIYQFTSSQFISNEYTMSNGVCKKNDQDTQSYSYDKVNNTVKIGGIKWDITKLTSGTLQLSASVSDRNGDGTGDKIIADFTRQ